MIDRLKRIIRRMTRLWKLWQFMRFAKKSKLEYGELLKQYRTKKHLTGQQVADLWESAVEKKFIEMGSPHVHIRTKGDDFLEGGIIPVGLIIAMWERYGFFTGFISATIILTVLGTAWTILEWINNHWI